MYLLDTNVVCEMRKGRKAQRSVRMWAQALSTDSLYLSVVSILELEIGTLLVERRDRKQGAILRSWIDGHVLPSFSGRILAIDTVVAQRCAALHVPNPRSDRDALIAATALVHSMTVVSRNVTHFQPTGGGRGQPLAILSVQHKKVLDRSDHVTICARCGSSKPSATGQ